MEQLFDRYNSLIEYISSWPDWKINALCLDESDLKIKKLIIQHRESQRNKKRHEQTFAIILTARNGESANCLESNLLNSDYWSPIIFKSKGK